MQHCVESLAPSSWQLLCRYWKATNRSPQSHLFSRLTKPSSLRFSWAGCSAPIQPPICQCLSCTGEPKLNVEAMHGLTSAENKVSVHLMYCQVPVCMVQAVTAARHMAGPGSAATRPQGCSSQPGLLQGCFVPRAVLCFCLVEMQKVAISPFLQCVWTPWMAALPSSILTHLCKLVSPANFMSKHWAPSNCFRNFTDINTLLKEAAKYTPGLTNHSWPESSKQAETQVNNHSYEKL